jgi:hypothetical protein
MVFCAGLPAAVADDVNANQSTTSVAVGLVDVSFLSVPVFTPGPRKLIIHYAAECRSEDGYIEYDIQVDGAMIPPTDDAFSALCSSPASSATVGITVMKTVLAGNHLVRVRGHIQNGVGPGRIDDQSLVVEVVGP